MGIGRDFQERTKYVRGKIPEGFYGGEKRPEPYKTYPNAPAVRLPQPAPTGGMGLWDVLANRRSKRSYGNGPVTAEELSRLLWAASGVTRRSGEICLRTAPSAGALFPVETYLAARTVTGIAAGLYHYGVRDHVLSRLREGDLSRELADAALGQAMVEQADIVFLFSAVFDRSAVKYLDRAYRYVYLDAGHIAQNLLLCATALDLSACPVAALFDDEINGILGLDGEDEGILYLVSVGRERRGHRR